MKKKKKKKTLNTGIQVITLAGIISHNFILNSPNELFDSKKKKINKNFMKRRKLFFFIQAFYSPTKTIFTLHYNFKKKYSLIIQIRTNAINHIHGSSTLTFTTRNLLKDFFYF